MEEEEAAIAESQTWPTGEDSCAELTAGVAVAMCNDGNRTEVESL